MMPSKPGTIHLLLEKFDWALSALGGKPGPRDLEALSVLVFEAMTNRDRTFHNPWHIFNVASNGSPVETIAALFHDVVYYQVDQGFPERLGKLLAPFVDEGPKGALTLKPQGFKRSLPARLVLEIFGLDDNQKLSLRAGQNEVLSAIAAVRALERFLTPRDCVAIACAIEATIPFRRIDNRGRTPMQRLALRLADVNKRRRLGLDDDTMQVLMRSAVHMGNSDVENFSAEPAEFLDNTWRLLPETNPALRAAGLYTIRDYRLALQKMEVFFGGLEPTCIFLGYDGFPEEQTLRKYTEAARRNIELSVRYLRSKVAAVSILEALAESTGGDAPIGLFMGDLPNPVLERGVRYRRIDDFLPPRNSWVIAQEANAVVLGLLDGGRSAEIWFDSSRSPLAAFVYAAIGDTGVQKVIDRAQRLFERKLPARKFLETIPDQIVGPIAVACANMVRTRREALMALDRRPKASATPAKSA